MTSSKEIKYFLDGVEVGKQNWDAYGCSDMTVTDFGEFFSIECKNKKGHSTRLKAENPMKPLEDVKNSTIGFLYSGTPLNLKSYLKRFENIIEEDINKFKEQGFFKEAGKKDNSYKLPMSVLFKQFPRALQAVVLASCYGHNKYKDTDSDFQNFRRVGGENIYSDANLRHQLDKEIYGEKDLESGLHHLFHEAFNKLAEVELYLEENKIDIKEYAKEYLKNL